MFKVIKEWNEVKASKSIRRIIMAQFILSVIGWVGLMEGYTQGALPLLLGVSILSFAVMGVMMFNDFWIKRQEKNEPEKN